MIHLLLFTTLLLQDRVEIQSNAIVIRIAGEASPELRRGIEFGVAEMAHTATLMRRSVILAKDSSVSPTAIVIAGGSGPVPAGDTVTRLHAGPLPPGAEACEFSVAPPDPKGDGAPAVWDASLSKYGASELNERFDRTHATPMTGEAYLGWVAVKALVEAELKRRPGQDHCKTLAALKFDGHKGRPLFFEPATRTLSQPLYVIKNGKVVGETK
jgi:hypothetical protein